MTTLGPLRVRCPLCRRRVGISATLDTSVEARAGESKPGTYCIGRIVPDYSTIYAHLLTHGPGDGGEPLPVAA